jgi:F0F1-type ATP synthase assembly protein I
VSDSVHRRVAENTAASVDSTAFFGSIMAGMLLGFLADKVFGTAPLFIVIGIITGSVVGFWRMWQIATRDDEH